MVADREGRDVKVTEPDETKTFSKPHWPRLKRDAGFSAVAIFPVHPAWPNYYTHLPGIAALLNGLHP